jgi:hypothetical protein
MLVRDDDLYQTPAAFQRYVRDWFQPKTVLGFLCLVAEGRLHVDHNDYQQKGKSPGFAPCHSVDIAEYKEGLPKGVTLNDWMRKHEGKFVWHFYTSECRDHHDDD